MSNRRIKGRLERQVQLALGRKMAAAYEEPTTAELPPNMQDLLAKLKSVE